MYLLNKSSLISRSRSGLKIVAKKTSLYLRGSKVRNYPKDTEAEGQPAMAVQAARALLQTKALLLAKIPFLVRMVGPPLKVLTSDNAHTHYFKTDPAETVVTIVSSSDQNPAVQEEVILS